MSTNNDNNTNISEEMKTIVSYIKNMNMLDISKLIKILEEEFGVSASMPVVSAASNESNINTSKNEEEKEEKTSFDIILKSFGNAKIAVIKSIRAITGLGLADSKALVESAPKVVKEGVSKEESDKIKNDLEAAGAIVEIK